MECLLLVVRLLKEDRLEAAVRVLGWGDEWLNEEVEGENERVGGMRRGRDWGGEDGK